MVHQPISNIYLIIKIFFYIDEHWCEREKTLKCINHMAVCRKVPSPLFKLFPALDTVFKWVIWIIRVFLRKTCDSHVRLLLCSSPLLWFRGFWMELQGISPHSPTKAPMSGDKASALSQGTGSSQSCGELWGRRSVQCYIFSWLQTKSGKITLSNFDSRHSTTTLIFLSLSLSVSLGGSRPGAVVNTNGEEEHMWAILNPANLPPK